MNETNPKRVKKNQISWTTILPINADYIVEKMLCAEEKKRSNGSIRCILNAQIALNMKTKLAVGLRV